MSKFVDLNAVSNGNGNSSSTPYNSFAEINADNSLIENDTLFLRRGMWGRDSLLLEDISSPTIQQYTTGSDLSNNLPMVIASIDITASTWTQLDSGTGLAWYLDTTDTRAVYIDFDHSQGRAGDGIRCIGYDTEVEMQADPNDEGQWHEDQGGGVSRIWISNALNPNSATTVEWSSGTDDGTLDNGRCAIELRNCPDAVIEDVWTRMASGNNLWGMEDATNHKYRRLMSDYSGRWNSSVNPGNPIISAGGQVLIACYGPSSHTNSSTGVEINDIQGFDSQNNVVEISDLDGALIESNTGTDCGMGIEVWGFNTNCQFRYNRMYELRRKGNSNGHQTGIWFVPDTQSVGETGFNTDNVIEFEQYWDANNASISNENTCVRNKFRNNVLVKINDNNFGVIDDSSGAAAGNECEFENNIVASYATTGTAKNVDTPAGTESKFINNRYFNANPSTIITKYEYKGVNHTGTDENAFIFFAAESGDTGEAGDPLLEDIVSNPPDLGLQSISTAAWGGSKWWAGTVLDANGLSLPNINISFGAFQEGLQLDIQVPLDSIAGGGAFLEDATLDATEMFTAANEARSNMNTDVFQPPASYFLKDMTIYAGGTGGNARIVGVALWEFDPTSTGPVTGLGEPTVSVPTVYASITTGTADDALPFQLVAGVDFPIVELDENKTYCFVTCCETTYNLGKTTGTPGATQRIRRDQGRTGADLEAKTTGVWETEIPEFTGQSFFFGTIAELSTGAPTLTGPLTFSLTRALTSNLTG